jgi:hypothetical protein
VGGTKLCSFSSSCAIALRHGRPAAVAAKVDFRSVLRVVGMVNSSGSVRLCAIDGLVTRAVESILFCRKFRDRKAAVSPVSRVGDGGMRVN